MALRCFFGGGFSSPSSSAPALGLAPAAFALALALAALAVCRPAPGVCLVSFFFLTNGLQKVWWDVRQVVGVFVKAFQVSFIPDSTPPWPRFKPNRSHSPGKD